MGAVRAREESVVPPPRLASIPIHSSTASYIFVTCHNCSYITIANQSHNYCNISALSVVKGSSDSTASEAPHRCRGGTTEEVESLKSHLRQMNTFSLCCSCCSFMILYVSKCSRCSWYAGRPCVLRPSCTSISSSQHRSADVSSQLESTTCRLPIRMDDRRK
jgi:hypothetical protein